MFKNAMLSSSPHQNLEYLAKNNKENIETKLKIKTKNRNDRVKFSETLHV